MSIFSKEVEQTLRSKLEQEEKDSKIIPPIEQDISDKKVKKQEPVFTDKKLDPVDWRQNAADMANSPLWKHWPMTANIRFGSKKK